MLSSVVWFFFTEMEKKCVVLDSNGTKFQKFAKVIKDVYIYQNMQRERFNSHCYWPPVYLFIVKLLFLSKIRYHHDVFFIKCTFMYHSLQCIITFELIVYKSDLMIGMHYCEYPQTLNHAHNFTDLEIIDKEVHFSVMLYVLQELVN